MAIAMSGRPLRACRQRRSIPTGRRGLASFYGPGWSTTPRKPHRHWQGQGRALHTHARARRARAMPMVAKEIAWLVRTGRQTAGEIELYPACITARLPQSCGVYDHPAAERHWDRLIRCIAEGSGRTGVSIAAVPILRLYHRVVRLRRTPRALRKSRRTLDKVLRAGRRRSRCRRHRPKQMAFRSAPCKMPPSRARSRRVVSGQITTSVGPPDAQFVASSSASGSRLGANQPMDQRLLLHLNTSGRRGQSRHALGMGVKLAGPFLRRALCRSAHFWRIAAGASRPPQAPLGRCDASHSAVLPPNEVPIRLSRSRQACRSRSHRLRQSPACSSVLVFSAEAPPRISNAMSVTAGEQIVRRGQP